MKYIVGDKIVIKTWERMAEMFGVTGDAVQSIKTKPYGFCSDMERSLSYRENRKATIAYVGENYYHIILDGDSETWKSMQWNYYLTDDMIEGDIKMSSFIEKIKKQWDKYKVQIIGAVLLVAAFVLAVLNKAVPAWIVLVVVGILDLGLIYVWKEITISRWIRGLTGPTVDSIIMLGLFALCWWLKGEMIALWFLLGLLNNHLFEKD